MSRRLILIEYFFTETRLLAFVIRSDFEQPVVVTIDTSLDRLRGDITEGASAPGTRLAEVLQRESLAACIAPILEWTAPDDVLCIVPSGELFYAPLHAVPAEGSPLIARNPVFYAPSASALRYCVRRRVSADAPSRGITVFGNPTWDLIHAEEEARAVAKQLGSGDPIIGVDVTPAQWFQAMETSDIIHFAGHAYFDAGDPLASSLILANDTPVTARELFTSAVAPIRLITLSGCETGVNHIHPGDEILGLSRALLYAGASSLILTLWRIDDSASAELMKTFYAEWLEQGLSKVDALAVAQRRLISAGYTNPYHFAPFVLIGDWF